MEWNIYNTTHHTHIYNAIHVQTVQYNLKSLSFVIVYFNCSEVYIKVFSIVSYCVLHCTLHYITLHYSTLHIVHTIHCIVLHCFISYGIRYVELLVDRAKHTWVKQPPYIIQQSQIQIVDDGYWLNRSTPGMLVEKNHRKKRVFSGFSPVTYHTPEKTAKKLRDKIIGKKGFTDNF